MEIVLIAAIAKNNAIGKDNKLLWHLPDDFKHFKAQTTGHYIIMGRKTFETFPKPLPNRTHIIITNQKDYVVPENCYIVNSVADALHLCKEHQQQKVYVIGGGQIYEQMMNVATRLEITHVDVTPDADAFFPQIDPEKWQPVSVVTHAIDEKHLYAFNITVYKKK